jgi:hypothetical protein
MHCDVESHSATILPFARRPGWHGVGLTVHERIQAMRWSDAARSHGVRMVQFHEPEPGDDPMVGAFLLVYRGEELWAAWGIARRTGGYEVWRPSSGATVGLFDSMGRALAAILEVG